MLVDAVSTWVVTLNPVRAYSGPSSTAVDFGTIPGLTTLQLLDYQGDFAHVVDPRSKSVLCDTPITAPSSETVAKALSDKLAALRAGTDVVVVPDPLTDNRGPAKKGKACQFSTCVSTTASSTAR